MLKTIVVRRYPNLLPLVAGLLLLVALPSFSAEIAIFHLDEKNYLGAPDEIIDSSSLGHHGSILAGTIPFSTSPVNSSNPGTCGYVSQVRGAISVPGLPVSTVAGAKTTVSFWMRWDGRNSVMPIGWGRHDLWMVGGTFGFNSARGDVYGISSAGMVNTWTHVSAEFTNGDIHANRLVINGVEQTLTQLRRRPNNRRAYVSSELRIGGWSANINYRFSGDIDEVHVHTGALTLSEAQAIMKESHPCPAEPLAKWDMDEFSWEGSANEVVDSSLNSHHGTAMNGLNTSNADPVDNSSLGTCSYGEFDGVDDYVLIGNPSDLNFTGEITLSAWIRPDSSSGIRNIIAHGHRFSPNQEMIFRINSGKYQVGSWNGGDHITSATIPSGDIGTNTWVHLAGVYDGTTWRLYRNGAEIASKADAIGSIQVSDNWVIGARGTGTERFFKGGVDEARIYSKALSPLEINNLMNERRKCLDPPELVAQFHLEASEWTGAVGEVIDSSGNDHHGRTISRTTPGIVSPAIPTDPGTCGYASQKRGAISIPGLPVSTTLGDKTTVSFWMKWDGTNSTMPIGWKRHDLWMVGGQFGFNTGAGDLYGISSAGLANTWTHVSAEFTNGNVKLNRLVVNGVEQTLSQLRRQPRNTNAYVSNDLRIGGWSINGSYRFKGDIDEVHVHTNSLTILEVQEIMNATRPCSPGSIAQWNFDESTWDGSVDEVIDSGDSGLLHGQSFNGTLNEGSTPAIINSPGTCRYGNFDGIDDYIEVADQAVLDLDSQFTITAWIRPTSLPAIGNDRTIISKGDNYELNLTDSGMIEWRWKNNKGKNRRLTTTGTALNPNEWNHVALSFTSNSRRQKIYINGLERASDKRKRAALINSNPVQIGQDQDQAGRNFEGLIDEVRIYDSELIGVTIAQIMNDTRPCAITGPDHFLISHDGAGIHCTGEAIQVSALDAADKTVTDYTGTITLDTTTGKGDWSLVTGSGVIDNATLNDGIATYTYNSADKGVASFSLSYTSGTETFNINVFEGSVSDNNDEGDITFAPSGFVLTASKLNNPPPATINDPIPTIISGENFPVHITAFGTTVTDTECGVIESYHGSKSIGFSGSYLNPTTGTKALTVNGNNISMSGAAATQSVTFTNGQAGVQANYVDVGMTRIYAEDRTGANLISGATNDFVVRPDQFLFSNVIRVSDSNANPAATDHTGGVFAKAGEDFSVTVTAVNIHDNATPNYGNETNAESIKLSHALVAPIGGQAGSLNGSLSNQGGGVYKGTFNWSEVGIISLTSKVTDNNYLGTGNITEFLSHVGRFTPDHFEVPTADITHGALQNSCVVGGFSYIGESVSYSTGSEPKFKIEAKNLDGATTLNYKGNYDKLIPGSITIPQISEDASQNGSDGSNLMTVTHNQGSASLTTVSDGVFEYQLGADDFTYNRDSNSLIGSFNSDIDLTVSKIEDGDSVTDNFAPPSIVNPVLEPAFANLRYGRLMIENAHGSELLPLILPIKAQMFDATSNDFITNPDDSCSTFSLKEFDTITLNPVSFATLTTSPPLLTSSTLTGGEAEMTISAPGAGNTGSVGVTLEALPWLEFDWGRPIGELNRLEPKATATFGIFQGNTNLIYRREIR